MKKTLRNNPEPIEDVSTLKQRIRELEQSVAESRCKEEALREGEAKYRLAFESTADGIFTIDCNFNILSITPSVERQLGYKVQEIINRPIQDLNILTSESLTRAVSDVMQILSGLEITGAVYEFIAKDGTRKIGEVTGTPIIQEGKIIGVTAVVRDITERKLAEEAFRVREKSYRTLAENLPEIVYRIHIREKNRMQFFNNMLVTVTGYNEEELIEGKVCSIDPLIIEEDRDRIIAEVDAAIKDNRSFSVEYCITHKDGTRRFLIERGRPIFDNDGLNSIDGIIRDVTAEKLFENALRESEERYRTLVENASDIVFRLDDTGRITFVNPAALRIMGHEEKKIIGRHYPTFIRPDMQAEAMKFFGHQFVKGIPNTYSEYPVIVKDGSEIWLGQNTQLIFQDGKVIGFQAVARDITERRRMEEVLRDSENRYRELSIVDDLTQLYNSRHFYFQLKIELDRSNRYEQPLTLLLLDLDNFKHFNDAYGHVEGDQVLLRLGQVIKRCLRETDFAYRYGGEEFTIILPMTTSVEGAVTAERIRTEFKKETFSPAPNQDVHVTVSIGLAQCKPQEDMKAFVHRVDQFMYQGKNNGKDRVCSEP